MAVHEAFGANRPEHTKGPDVRASVDVGRVWRSKGTINLLLQGYIETGRTAVVTLP